VDTFVFEVQQKKNTTSFHPVVYLFLLNPNPSTLFFYAPYRNKKSAVRTKARQPIFLWAIIKTEKLKIKA
jgi:hypothetical protein